MADTSTMAYLIIYYLFDGYKSDNNLNSKLSNGHQQTEVPIDNIIDRVRASLSILLTIILNLCAHILLTSVKIPIHSLRDWRKLATSLLKAVSFPLKILESRCMYDGFLALY